MPQWMKNVLVTGLAMTSAPALAAPQPSGNAHAVVATARQIIHEKYVLPDVATALERALTAAELAGTYRGLTGDALAARINADMAAVAHDKHLSMSYNPQGAAELVRAGPGHDGPLQTDVARAIDRKNAGVRELRVLPGNIRYMAYDGFAWDSPGAVESLETAMRFLRGGDAYIIDIRRNGGGSPDAVAAIVSYFLPTGTPLMRFEMRGDVGESTKAPKAPFSLAGKPLYVLTSQTTVSAAEEFSTHVKAFGFGRLVGENTAGGGFRNDLAPLPGGYVLSVSVGRAVSLKTGKDWERVGVAPDIAVPADSALLLAEHEAMTRIAATASVGEKIGDAALLSYYRALETPVVLARAASSYAGTFGDRTVTVAGNGLEVSQAGRPSARLVPVAPDSFAPDINPASRMTFVLANGTVKGLQIIQQDGSVSSVQKE